MKKLEQFTLSDDPKCNKFQKTANHAIKCYSSLTLLEHFYIIKSGTSEKIIGYPALHTSMLKTCFYFNDFPKRLTSLQFMTNSFH